MQHAIQNIVVCNHTAEKRPDLLYTAIEKPVFLQYNRIHIIKQTGEPGYA